MNWLFPTLTWYFMLLGLGLVFFPFAFRLFGKRFFDFGFPFAKTIALAILTYTMFVLGVVRILAFSQVNLLLLLFVFLLLNLFVLSKNKLNLKKLPKKTFFLIIFEELLFLVSFLFWVFVRGQEPSLHGLEKFMDFGFINSILKSSHFPPLDMWLSADPSHPQGYPINYYYFGHLFGSLLIKLSRTVPAVGYNLILATIFGLAISQTFSIVVNMVYYYWTSIKKVAVERINIFKIVFFGLLGAFIVNLGGNLHTIYLFTKGYPNDNPTPFWQILSGYNPATYWYPNATRFIPFTIHEFPSYSWVVADLHGHVFDIPFVLLTLAVLFQLCTHMKELKKTHSFLHSPILLTQVLSLGFLTAVHYMTNAFDGPIYILLTTLLFFIIFRLSKIFFSSMVTIVLSFIVFSLPFSFFFKPFVSGIGVNCSPSFLVTMQKLGPFLFEKGNCQISPIWMLFVLWGFFFICFLIYLGIKLREKINDIDIYVLTLFILGFFLIIIPEFFYIKDIYPAHFRANTMFKLGYQAFIMMGIASTYTFFRIKTLVFPRSIIFACIFVLFFFFTAIYPTFSIPSYYGQLTKPIQIDGSLWLNESYSEDKEIIDYINKTFTAQENILEAQGDSYTDYERISAYTGMPTIAGWWVHEWLWRGSSEVVGSRIADITTIYESSDEQNTKKILKKYGVHYVVVSSMERKKYPNLNEDKFKRIGRAIFKSSNKLGTLYRIQN